MKGSIKTKIIRGKPIYLYKGSQYIDQPPKTFLGKMYYNENENTTYIKCIKKSKTFESLCLLCILACTCVTAISPSGEKEMLYYTQIVDYYDGKYYLNIENFKYSKYPVICILLYKDTEISRRQLNPGDKWITAEAAYYDRDIKLFIEYEYPIIKRYDILNLSIVNREVKE